MKFLAKCAAGLAIGLFGAGILPSLVPVLAAFPAQGTLIVLNKSDNSASLIDIGTGAEVAKLPTGDAPHEVAVSPDGRVAVVTNYGAKTPGSTLTVLDLRAGKPAGTIDLKPYQRPHGVVFLKDGRRVLVTAEAQQKLLMVNISEMKVERAYSTGQEVSHMVVVSPDEKRAFVSNIGSGSVSVIDLQGGKLLKIIPTGEGAEGIDITADGAQVWVTNRAANTVSVISVASLSVEQSIPCAAFPIRIKFTPDSRLALVSCARSGEVAVLDVAARREVRRIPMKLQAKSDKGWRLFKDVFGESPVPIGILVTPDNKTAFVANSNADRVAVIDLAAETAVGYFDSGKQPDGLGYSPLSFPEN